MKYALDTLDRINAYYTDSATECTPTFQIFLDEDVDCEKLRRALEYTLRELPYYKTKLAFDGKFYLVSNDAPLPIYHCRLEDRPKNYGKSGGDYTFQVSYYENALTFEMCHFTNDALGFLHFIKTVVSAYFGVYLHFSPDVYLKLPYEENYDEAAGKPKVREQQGGFFAGRIESAVPETASSRCTMLSVSLNEILTYRKRVDASPAAIISALLAKAFRSYLKKSAPASSCGETDNVRGKIVVSTRGALDITTVHNCYLQAFITYTDAFDKFDFSTACTFYRAILDLQVQKECALYNIRKKTELLREMEADPDQPAVLEAVRQSAAEDRKSLCNFNFSYLGAVSFDSKIDEHIVDFRAVCFNENSDFGVIAYSLGDRIYMMISENYLNRDVIREFIDVSRDLGISFEEVICFDYQQAHFEPPEELDIK